jgi:uncharacterized protein YciI
MSYYAVVREAGPGWRAGTGIAGQPALADHSAFMTALAAEGFVLFGGPLAGSETGRLRVLLVVDADGEAEIHDRLAGDPWVESELLVTASVEPWRILVGEDRLASGDRL